ncbi:NAD(P)H-hydrate dehydratase [Ignatzschineria cameli]|uniref:ADP-dependent (S)-NAD(P)H-hydrate dehydratase n=1 Tax=Ignatzschineria cameli TaxID=2182793 RepID=A0A2U2ARK4_9GAMM|nr:NAD(P)H-hydrate dehydratase [Ignatzschineria cameli]PWD86741.1 NAD(P)H-hydrate dehydratase [Ignatzschineria cameli]PWD86905.1 NAD(P)H-hydrate dehydratase [Ignatzschineria cameli]PWD91878.1 NAD(P)H-hydrate dehydratase [Ignatzschineria cameli]PWD93535.1 NAD(P)H-hydrate dehydratase [Ignatzschineria cameli]PWD94277.1 NAD(P)H-hydrate dehydratase [Ignatzschineria cameli]
MTLTVATLTPSEKRWFAITFPLLVQPRPEESHKGTFGTLHIIGGGIGMTGAPVLAGIAALKSGCGKVILGLNQEPLGISLVATAPELMLRHGKELLQEGDASALVFGCGLGMDTSAERLMQMLLQARRPHQPLLIDADGLNLLASMEDSEFPLLGEETVLTPHPKEAARLLGCSVAEIQHDRERSAQRLVEQFGCWIVLKGHHTLIASPRQEIWCNQTGNSGLATAGSGDLLSGIIGSLLAQNMPMMEAVRGGVWLHGRAADLLVAKGIGPIGLTAHEIIDEVRSLRNQLVVP